MALPQLLGRARPQKLARGRKIDFGNFVFQDNFTRKKMRAVTRAEQPRSQNSDVLEDKEAEDMQIFMEQWRGYLEIKKFQRQAIMEKMKLRPAGGTAGQESTGTNFRSGNDFYRTKRLIKEEILQLNKEAMTEYLSGKEKFDKKEQMLSQLYFGAASFREMRTIVARMMRSQTGQGADLSKFLASRKSDEGEKIYMRQRHEKLRESMMRKQEQETGQLEESANKFIERLKLNIRVKRLFVGDHLVEPSLEEVLMSDIPVGSVLSNGFKLYQPDEKQKPEFISLFKEITSQDKERAVIEGLKRTLSGCRKQYELACRLTDWEKQLFEFVRNDDDFAILKHLQKHEDRSRVRLIRDRWGNSPLHFAAKHAGEEVLGILLKEGFDPCDKNLLGKSALDLAARFRNGALVKLSEAQKQNKTEY